MSALPSYSTGTVSVNAGDTTIVGVGTIWSGVNARPGDDIVIAGHTVIVQDVVDETHIAIDAWPYSNVAGGAAYKLVHRSPLRFAGGQAMADVSALVAALNTDGFYVFVGPSLSVPDPSYGNDGQYAFQPDTGKLWLKTGGAWSFQGVHKPFGTPAPYDNAHTYSLMDVATSGGSSYVWINSTPGSGHAPPNATYWAVLASVGGAGPQGSGYGGSSTSSVAIGTATGTRAFDMGTATTYAYQIGDYVRAKSAANGANFVEGFVLSYAGGVVTVGVMKVGGSGTFTDWNMSLVGMPGAGDMQSTNNLSDVANKAIARKNLGIILDPLQFNAKGTGPNTATKTVSIASGTNALSATAATWTAADVNSAICIPGAGPSGGNLITTIATFVDSQHITLGANASTTLTAASKSIAWGVDDTGAFTSALAALTLLSAGCGTLYIPSGYNFLITSTIDVPIRCAVEGDFGGASKIYAMGCHGFQFNFTSGFGITGVKDVWLQGIGCETKFGIYNPGTLTEANIIFDLQIHRCQITFFNIGVVARTLQNFTVADCHIENVNSGIRCAGFVAEANIRSNKIIYGAGCGTGTSIGIQADYFNYTSGSGLLRPEAFRLFQNTTFKFAIDIQISAAIYASIEGNSTSSLGTGCFVVDVISGVSIRNNYFEIQGGSASVSCRVSAQASVLLNKIIIEGNTCEAGNGPPASTTVGIMVGYPTGGADNVVIRDNICYNQTLYDIWCVGSGNVTIDGNRCDSPVTPNIVIASVPANKVCHVGRNKTINGIAWDAADMLAGRIQIFAPNITSAGAVQDGWTSYTATLTPDGGAFTTITQAIEYKVVGTMVFLRGKINIPSPGTATGGLSVSLPSGHVLNGDFAPTCIEFGTLALPFYGRGVSGNGAFSILSNTGGEWVNTANRAVDFSGFYRKN
jgi:hypothetical protein